ncbi:uncharacterized protein FFMR_15841 [Fusarium fujikuroi]|nr:uncharacterized protein FFMR_15841 [Fusarium fujikuroi]
MTDTNDFSLCKDCLALTINDQILDAFLEDLPCDSETESQNGLEIKYTKTDELPDLPELASAASAGCQFCEFFLRFFSNGYLQYLKNLDKQSPKLSVTIEKIRYFQDNDHEATGFLSHTAPINLIGLAVDLHINHHTSQECIFKDTLWFPLRAKDASFHRKNPRIGTRAISSLPLLEQNLAMIADWISDCDTHVQCRPSESPLFPTRLVDIGESENNSHIRLLNTADYSNLWNQFSRYIAVSYCWGIPTASQNHLKTTPTTYKNFLNNIPNKDLPQTFRDLIVVARKLNVRYIWIDALCIIQDDIDQADWKTESIKMKDVYGQAYLTIAPISSHSSFDGFLSSKKQTYLKIPIQSSKRPAMNDFCMLGPVTYQGRFWPGTFMADMWDSTWHIRGWTFQEEELSRRILYFGERTIHFQCNTFLRSGDSDCILKSNKLLCDASQLDWCLLNIPGQENPIFYNSTYQPWYDICSEFSGRLLTNFDDTLPAISGFAEYYATSLKESGQNGEYLLGIWGNDILSGLCWTPANRSQAPLSQLLSPSRIPAWTWVSYRGKVEWSGCVSPTRQLRGKSTVNVHNFDCEQNRFSMNDVQISIRGHMKRITAIVETGGSENPTSYSNWAYAVQVDENIVAECRPDYEELLYASDKFDLSLLLLADSCDANHEDETSWLIGLMLIYNEFKFIRVGIFRIRDESSLFDDTEAQLYLLG